MWSTQLLLVMVRARIERKRKAPATKLDAEVAASLGLLDVVEGLAEGESLIDVLIDALEEIGKNSIVKKLKLLKGVLANAQKTVRSNAVKTSRMPNLAYVHRRSKGLHSDDQKSTRAKSTVATSGSHVRRPNKRVRTSERLITEKLDRPNDPLPADGKTYSLYEAIEIVKGSSGQRDANKTFIHWKENDLICCCKATFYKHLQAWQKKGIMPKRQDAGTDMGRPAFLSIENVHKLNAANMMTPGLATGSDATKQALKNEMIKTCEARGMSTLTLKSPSKCTVKNYHNLAATQEGVSLTSSTIAKTDRRYASETSLRSCACLMACIAFNHFIEADDDTEVNPNLGDGAQQFMKLLNHVSDVPMTPIKSHHIYSTDDTTEFICEGIMDSAKKEAG